MTIKDTFKNNISRNIFYNKYAQGSSDSWGALAVRLVDDVCGTRGGTLPALMSKEDRAELVHMISEMKFIPGGRYLYYAGRPFKAYNNCFAAETRVLTDQGYRKVSELGTAKVLSPVDGKYYPAEFLSHGKQKLQKITFTNQARRQRYVVHATKTHHWPLVGGGDTYDLRVGDWVPANTYNTGHDPLGFVHGMLFGDGTAQGQLRLCADKGRLLSMLQTVEHTLTYPPHANGDPCLYYPQKVAWKEVPGKEATSAYIASFIAGWLKADGNETSGSNKLCSVNYDALLWFRENAAFAGITITGSLRLQDKDTKLYIQSYAWGDMFKGYRVESIQPHTTEEVFCPSEPVHQQFIIEGNIHTYNCYLLRAEADTREEWANVFHRSSSCLLTGGGIGIDYSILRESGSALKRTGGTASGPLPLMYAVNEIGRNVMQGGSRRSAIYASLNWQHPDIPEFLVAKNWRDQEVAGTNGLTVADLKEADFNYRAPLDMTNISLNYDNAWLNDPDRAHNPTFLKNCAQAMSTGEPGFSFNFGEKENETLRNACTEVTSEDDSDVCNLGSINLGNIVSLDEFTGVVSLASRFLVCGTLRADLPYDKVYKVREKNRRLGLGLMGIHEWLLRRGEKYEVTPELHQWLEVYQNESERAANEHCDRFYISRPVAYRAIAPTGTIGLIACTTTGIEPLLAVAYKRRYLTNGTNWKYEFVIDTTAKHLIEEHGVDPETIDTAYSLASDYERRIKFQADIQDYVDMSISSTINLPPWGSAGNDVGDVVRFAETLSKYAPRLRGFTAYPDGSRGGQPLTEIPYYEALGQEGVVYEETPDICDITGKGGSCGV